MQARPPRRSPASASLRVLLTFLTLLALGLSGCSGASADERVNDAAVVDVPPAGLMIADAATESGGPHGWDGALPAPGQIPVTPDDPLWGNPLAPVTVVVFSDFQCPYCLRAASTLKELREHYRPDQLRIAFKHNPLPFHPEARPAAELGVAIHRMKGPEAFWRFHDDVFLGSQRRLDSAGLERAAARAGLSSHEVMRVMDDGGRDKVDEDIALAARLGANGTPSFFVNGRFIQGAQPRETFESAIDDELRLTREALAEGISAERLYAHRTARNMAEAPSPSAPMDDGPKKDLAIHRVPVGSSPVLGPSTALVTVVMFADFQCPFCARVVPTIADIRKRYGGDVRVVFKHNPLPFHPRAEPAAELAIEAFKQRGAVGFWAAHDALFAQNTHLEDPDLEALARSLGLDVGRVMGAVAQHRYQSVIDDDQDLADDLDAGGTPHFFINGRRIVGAQPLASFEELIDEQLAKANALVQAGTPRGRVYDELMKTAVGPEPPERVVIPAPSASSPSRGPKNAPVVIQAFMDFQCPFCGRAHDTVTELQKKFPSQVRLVFRHMPLPFHADAPQAHDAALEARRQKGDVGFWKMHDLLYENQKDLSETAILAHARAMGLDVAAVTNAMHQSPQKAVIDADLAIAQAAGISGTPTFVINGYLLGGAQPLKKFEKVVRLALDDLKRGGPKVAAP